MAWTGWSGADARAVALGASVVFHAAVLLLLARYLSQVPPTAEAPAIQVTLVPRTKPTEAPRERRRDEPERRLDAPSVAPRAAPPTDAIAPAPLTPGPAPSPDVAGAGDAQRVLRSLSACDPARWDRLSPEARARCEARAQRSAPADGRLKLDPSGRYVVDDQPFLSKKPKDGCRARATGDVDAYGDSGHVRAGVGCAFSF